MQYIFCHLLDIVTIIGYVLEISGVVMMASRFLGVDVFSLIIGMYSAIFKSGMANMISDLAREDEENVYKTFRGLSLVLWGFSLQFTAFVFDKFW